MEAILEKGSDVFLKKGKGGRNKFYLGKVHEVLNDKQVLVYDEKTGLYEIYKYEDLNSMDLHYVEMQESVKKIINELSGIIGRSGYSEEAYTNEIWTQLKKAMKIKE